MDSLQRGYVTGTNGRRPHDPRHAGRQYRHRRPLRARSTSRTSASCAPPSTEAAEDCDRLRLDLTGIEFIDSTGLGGLLELRSTLRARNVTLEIEAGEGPVRQAVEITGLAELLALRMSVLPGSTRIARVCPVVGF